MLTIDRAVRRLFSFKGWNAQYLDDRHLRVFMQGQHAQWQAFLEWPETQHLFVCRSICPLYVPVQRRERVAEFLARVNYGLLVGNFELDFSDGEVQFRTSTLLHQGRIGREELKNLVTFNLSMLDDALPGLAAVSFGDKSPEEAANEVDAEMRNTPAETAPPEGDQPTRPHGERLRELGSPPASN